MTHINKYLAKITLLSFLFAGVIVLSHSTAMAATRDTKTKPAAARTMKPAKARTAKPRKAKAMKKKDVTLDEARQRALRKVKGTVEKEEERTDKGKEFYTFEIRNSKGKMSDVWVEQKTGKVTRHSSGKG
jgi:uncharacterized membrane protein YkoI